MTDRSQRETKSEKTAIILLGHGSRYQCRQGIHPDTSQIHQTVFHDSNLHFAGRPRSAACFLSRITCEPHVGPSCETDLNEIISLAGV